MRCRQCGWSTSLADRDLFTGKCSICQKIDKSQPELDRESIAAYASYRHAQEELSCGETPEAVTRKFVAAGMSEDEARATVEQLCAELRPIVEALRNQFGLSEEASYIEVLQKARGAVKASNRGTGLVAMLIGIAVFLAGVGIALATRTIFVWVLGMGVAVFFLGLLQSIFGFGIKYNRL